MIFFVYNRNMKKQARTNIFYFDRTFRERMDASAVV